jgi:hypothetical protein
VSTGTKSTCTVQQAALPFRSKHAESPTVAYVKIFPVLQVTETAFRRFLIDTPLVPSHSTGGVRFGSFHQQYWVDGQSLAPPSAFALADAEPFEKARFWGFHCCT